MSAVPRKVQEQIDRANSLIERDTQGNPGNGEPAAPQREVDEGDPPREPAAEPQPPTPEPQPQESGLSDAERALFERLEIPEDKANDVGYLRRRLAVLEGKYRTEVREAIPRLKGEIDYLRSETARLQEQGGQGQEGHEPTRTDAIRKLEEDLSGEFGNETVLLLRKLIEQYAAPREGQREQDPGQEKANTIESNARFWAGMADAVPDYEEIDRSPEWKVWLDQPDPATGEKRLHQLQRHFRARDVSALANLFTTFKASGARREESSPPARDPSAELTPDGRPKAGDQAPPGPHAVQPVYSSQIKQFYSNAALGKYTDEEKERLRSQIDAAVAAGKVIRDT